MAGQRVLEVEQAEMGDAVAALDQHDVLGMIIAQDGDRAKAVLGKRLQYVGPGAAIRIDVNVETDGLAVPVREQHQLLEPLLEAVLGQAGHRRMLMQMDEHVGRQLVELPLPVGRQVERLAQPVVAEIAEQQQSAGQVAGDDLGRAESDRDQPFGDRDERPRVLVRWRSVHQHSLVTIAAQDPEITAEGGVAGQRLDPGLGPAAGCEKISNGFGWFHRGGHRPSHAAGTSAVKRRRLGPRISSDRRKASGQARSPARSGHSTMSTPSPSESRPSSASSA